VLPGWSGISVSRIAKKGESKPTLWLVRVIDAVSEPPSDALDVIGEAGEF